MNSYRRLKQKVAELEKELQVVCCKPDTIKAMEIVQAVKFANAKENNLMQGGRMEYNDDYGVFFKSKPENYRLFLERHGGLNPKISDLIVTSNNDKTTISYGFKPVKKDEI